MTYRPPTVAELEARIRHLQRDLHTWQRIGDPAGIAAYRSLLREAREDLAYARQESPLAEPEAAPAASQGSR